MEKITLKRTECTEEYTFGEIWFRDKIVCFSLEDPIRDSKIKHKTAIPYGTYKVILSYSQRFKRLMPRLLNVPNYTGILIHKGNTTEDTSGCILVGKLKYNTTLVYSAIAFDKLFSLIRETLIKDSLEIEIVKTEPLLEQPSTLQELPVQVEVSNFTEQFTPNISSSWKNSFPYLLKQILILLKMLLLRK